MKNKTSIPKLHSIKWKNGIHCANISIFPSREKISIPAHDVLMGACLYKLKDVVVFGFDENGDSHIFWSMADIRDAHYMFSCGAHEIMNEN